jgi:hypothetical protein
VHFAAQGEVNKLLRPKQAKAGQRRKRQLCLLNETVSKPSNLRYRKPKKGVSMPSQSRVVALQNAVFNHEWQGKIRDLDVC